MSKLFSYSDPKDPHWLFVVQVAPRSRQVCEGLEVEEQHSEEEKVLEVDRQQGEEEQHVVPYKALKIAMQVDEMDKDSEQAHDEEDEADLDDDVEGHPKIPLYNDDVEVHIEIDMIGASDLLEDDRLAETL